MSTRTFTSGKLDSKGMLWLSRIANLKGMQCPFGETSVVGSTVRYARCGDWCPHFGEVVKKNNEAEIEICHGTTIHILNYEDERSY